MGISFKCKNNQEFPEVKERVDFASKPLKLRQCCFVDWRIWRLSPEAKLIITLRFQASGCNPPNKHYSKWRAISRGQSSTWKLHFVVFHHTHIKSDSKNSFTLFILTYSFILLTVNTCTTSSQSSAMVPFTEKLSDNLLVQGNPFLNNYAWISKSSHTYGRKLN